MYKLKQLSVWFYLGLLVWLTIYILRRNNIIIPYINGYLTDLIAVPMYCYFVEFITNFFSTAKREFKRKDIISSIVYLTIIFEVICPHISDKFTSDPFDVVCYIIGGFTYYFLRKRMNKTQVY